MSEAIGRGDLDSLTLRFQDAQLEEAFQHEEGEAAGGGYRIITGATVVLWASAAVLFPLGTDIPFRLSGTIGGLMALVGSASLAASSWADTLNRQHGGFPSHLRQRSGHPPAGQPGRVVEGYAVGAIMLLFMFGFVSRTRFVFALVRTVAIAAGLGLVIWTYPDPGGLLLNAFIFVAAAAGSLVGLRLLERSPASAVAPTAGHRGTDRRHRDRASRVGAAAPQCGAGHRVEATARRRQSDRRRLSQCLRHIRRHSGFHADGFSFDRRRGHTDAERSLFDDLVGERGLEKIKTIGDAYMAVGGLPDPLPDHAIRVVDLAVAMLAGAAASHYFPGLALRVGVHSGPVAGGVLGTRRFAYDVWGTTVNVAARLEKAGVPGRIHVSEDTRSLTCAAFGYEPRGTVQLRGLGPMTTNLVTEPLASWSGEDRIPATPA